MNGKKNTKLTAYVKVFRFFWTCRRADALIAPLYYVFENFSPTISTIVLAGFYEAIFGVLNGARAEGKRLMLYGGAFIAFHVLREIIQIAASISTNAGVFEKSLYLLRERIGKKASGLPMLAYETTEVMEMKKRAEECVLQERIPSVFMVSAVLFTSVLGVGSLIFTLGIYNWVLAVIAVVSVAQFYIAAYIQEKKKYEISQELTREKRRRDYLWSLFLDVKSVKEMRIMGYSDYLAGRWKRSRDQIQGRMWEEEQKEHRRLFGCELLKLSGYLFGILFSLLLLMEGKISAGVFGAVWTAFISVQTTIRHHLTSIGRIPAFLEYVKDYFDFLELPDRQDGTEDVGEEIRSISLEQVTFRYPNGDGDTLKNIDLKIDKGETIAIVGENGSGKTTLVKVLLGVYEADRGDIGINGISMADLNRDALYDHIAYLSQDHMTYKMSLWENIVLGDPAQTAESEERVHRVLKNVSLHNLCAHGDPKEISLGREFGGIELSGGQAQRVAIARALYKTSDLIILDEPTSALDPIQETEILSQFLALSQGKTSLIISHRIGLCTRVDRIIVMRQGEIAEMGSHKELLARNGEYARLYKAQSHWYEAKTS